MDAAKRHPVIETRKPLYYGWILLIAVVFVMLAASGIRAVFGVFIKPIEAEFGWTRQQLSGAAALSLFVLGAVGPTVGWLADIWGPRRVMLLATATLGVGTILASFVGHLWQLYASAGVLMAMGAGGLGMATIVHHGRALVRGAPRSHPGHTRRRHVGGPDARRTPVHGASFASTAGGRPSSGSASASSCWPFPSSWLSCATIPGTRASSRTERARLPAGPSAAATDERRVPVSEAMGIPAFWLLALTFFVCGYTSNGLVLTHLIPHAAEHGFSEMHAAQALGLMGAMNIVGTVLSGWICDRFGRKGPLAFYYGVRGLSLIFLLYVWNVPSLNIFAAIFGLNYISTVPPTTTLTANIFGRLSVGALSGWIFFSHQVGSAIGAWAGGAIFDATGSYSWAFLSAAVMAFIAAGLSLLIKEVPVAARPTRRPTPTGAPVPAG